jgi:hypothetical protein
MLTAEQPASSRTYSVLRRLILAGCLTGGLLVSAAGVRAEAYPDAPVDDAVPVCDVAPATVIIDGGDVSNTTTLDLSADGGTAVGDASGGDDNLATTGDGKDGKDGKGKGKGNDKRKKDDRKKDDKAELAAAGNGGRADASADGGAIAVGNVNSGGNVGNAIAVGDTYGGYGNCGTALGGTSGGVSGGVFIDGGTVTNETIITVSADGSTAIADASGGDGNVASTGGRAGNGGSITSSAGNGGVATASADGGVISLGDINSGGNAGNAIGVGDTVVAPPICCAPSPPKPIPVVPITPPKPAPAPAPAPPSGKVVVVTMLPSTGAGPIPANPSAAMALLALTTGATSFATRRVVGRG